MSKAASLNPEDFVDGGGLIDDLDVVFESCEFIMFDYMGKVTPGVPSLKVEMSSNDLGADVEQYYSMGSANDWIPSDDGSQLVAVGKVSNIRTTTNGGIFLKSLIDAGFPVADLGDDITVLNGLQAHVIRVAAPKRPGLKKKPREDGREYEETILVVSEIISLPGEKKRPAAGKKKTVAKSKTNKEKVTKEDATDDVEANATSAVLEILAEIGTITKKELPAKIFQIRKEDPDRNALVKVVFDDDFLAAGPWEYDDGVLVSG